MTPELMWISRASLSGRGERLLIVSAAFVWNERLCQREQVQESFTAQTTDPHSSLRFNRTQMEAGLVGNYTVACPLMTAQLYEHWPQQMTQIITLWKRTGG